MRPIKYLVMSDIHLGHGRNRTFDIVNNLDVYFDYYKQSSVFSQLDIIFLAGDVFDGLLDLSSKDVHEISLWLGRLMSFCARFNIKLRVLEGTPSHDWKQSRLFETVFSIVENKPDFKYIDTLRVERIDDLELDILYIPDEWAANTSITAKQTKEILRELNISSVDIAIMHGAFQYQLRNVPGNANKHDESFYLNIVRHYISIGHIHSFSSYDRIIAQGSFDRLAHGEEEPKGAVVCSIGFPEGDSFDFIANKHAKLFKTIELKSKDVDASMAKINKVLAKVPDNSYIRISAAKDHPVYVGFDELKAMYPMLYFSKKNIDDLDESIPINNAVCQDDEYTVIAITPDNVIGLIMDEVKAKHRLSDTAIELMQNILEAKRLKA